MMKNKKVIATIAAAALLVLGGTTAFFMTADKPEGTNPDKKFEEKLEVIVKEKVEYGLNLSDKTFVVNTASGEKEAKFTELTPAVDASKVGKTIHELTLEKQKFEVEVTVADTVNPEISGIQEKFEFEAETNVEAELKKLVTAKDPIDGEVEVTFEINAKENTQREFNVVAKATDKNKNTTSEKFEVTVKEKVVVNEPTTSTPGVTTPPANTGKPAVANPAPSKPSTSNPAPTKPSKPEPTKPSKPAPTKPEPTKPSNPAPTKPEPTKPSNPAPTQPSNPGGVSAQYPNGTVALVSSVPSGATVYLKQADGYMFNYSKSLPSGAKVKMASVATYVGKTLIVSFDLKDASGVESLVELHQDGAVTYGFGYASLTDEDISTLKSLASQFRGAFKHNK